MTDERSESSADASARFAAADVFVAVIIFAAGFGALVAGVAMISVPWALVAGGVLAMAVGAYAWSAS